jgi:hypothetical protein
LSCTFDPTAEEIYQQQKMAEFLLSPKQKLKLELEKRARKHERDYLINTIARSAYDLEFNPDRKARVAHIKREYN